MNKRFAIRWSRTAEQDVVAILEYIARQDGAENAVRVYADLRAAINSLTSMPSRGRVVSELRAVGLLDFRELLVGPYRLFFRIAGRTVVLLGVVDGRRDLEELLLERALRDER